MAVYLHSIQLWNPPRAYSQAEAAASVAAQTPGRGKRIVRHIYAHTEIDQRHTAVGDFGAADPSKIFHDRGDGQWNIPTTGDRNRVFVETAKRAAPDVARATLGASADFDASDITHVITASCTGFFNPGTDVEIIRDLGLPASTQRFHLGFMGCYAALAVLRLARTICAADASAVVLVQCFELCSLHLQVSGTDTDAIVAGSLFGDGAGCALVSSQQPRQAPAYRLDRLATCLTPGGESAMAWDIGDTGFEIVLASYVADIIGENITSAVKSILEPENLTQAEIGFWAVHPGGPTILRAVEEALHLPNSDLQISRDVLRQYGNMSSVTLFFVLAAGLQADVGPRTLAMAFGPGLTVEMALMEKVGS